MLQIKKMKLMEYIMSIVHSR